MPTGAVWKGTLSVPWVQRGQPFPGSPSRQSHPGENRMRWGEWGQDKGALPVTQDPWACLLSRTSAAPSKDDQMTRNSSQTRCQVSLGSRRAGASALSQARKQRLAQGFHKEHSRPLRISYPWSSRKRMKGATNSSQPI